MVRNGIWQNNKLVTFLVPIQISLPNINQVFSFTNCFIGVRVAVDSEPVPGTLGASRELHGSPPHGTIHTQISTHTWGQFSMYNSPTDMFLGGASKPENSEETP